MVFNLVPSCKPLFFFQLDYIHRLMWQAQLKGNKSWILAPTPECDHVCQSFSFYVEPGDAGKLIFEQVASENCVFHCMEIFQF